MGGSRCGDKVVVEFFLVQAEDGGVPIGILDTMMMYFSRSLQLDCRVAC